MPKPITVVDPMVKPDPALEKRTRRVFTAEYKLSILQKADACKHGELGALFFKRKKGMQSENGDGYDFALGATNRIVVERASRRETHGA